MNKNEMEIQMKQQVETIILNLTKSLIEFDLELTVNKRNGDFIFEKKETNLTATVGRKTMSKLYTQYQKSTKEEL